MKTIETTTVVTMYEAFDGSQFRFENECLLYEAKHRAKDLYRFTITIDKVPRKFYEVTTPNDLRIVCRTADSENYTCYFSEQFKKGEYDNLVPGLIGFGYKDNDYLQDDHYVTSVQGLYDELDTYISKYENYKTLLKELVDAEGENRV